VDAEPDVAATLLVFFAIILLGGLFQALFGLMRWGSLIKFAPHPVMAGFQNMAAMLLFALWPLTRLVHVFSAPLGYLTRPYIVYRSRDDQLGSRAPRRGWEKVK